MRSITLFLILILAIGLAAGCRSADFEGVYFGELRTESFRADGSAIPGDADLATENDVKLTVRQDGERLSVSISRSRLLGDCEFYLKVSKNGTAYLETPQTCTQSLPLEGSMSGKNGELNLVLRGFDSSSSRTFRFRGYRK